MNEVRSPRVDADPAAPHSRDTVLSPTDRAIVRTLAQRGRLPFKELGETLGLPASTAHGRVRSLERRGVIRGYRAEIDPEALGQRVSALILARVHQHLREQVPLMVGELRGVPGVQQIFMIGGETDLVVHVSCASVHALRDLISQHFGSHPALAQTQTQIVFEHATGLAPV